jgi:hypothetical protein
MPQQPLSNSESFVSKRDVQTSASHAEKPGAFSVPAMRLSAIRKQPGSIATRNAAFIEPVECHRVFCEEIYFVSKIHTFAVVYRGFECERFEVFCQHRTRQLTLGLLGFAKVCFSVWGLVLVRPAAGAEVSITPVITYLVMLAGAELGGSIFVGVKAFLVSFSCAIQLDAVTVRLRAPFAKPSDLPRAIANLISLADKRTSRGAIRPCWRLFEPYNVRAGGSVLRDFSLGTEGIAEPASASPKAMKGESCNGSQT